jgi:hypothetical protein
MSKKIKIVFLVIAALASLSAIVVLANEVATTIYMPVVYQNYTVKTSEPPREVAITGFSPSTNPQNDYVVLTNMTSATIDMTGWWLKAENQSGRYDFPAGFKLGSGQKVNVRSGVGTNSATDLHISLPFSLWTVSENCAYVRDSGGTLQDKQCVSAIPTPTASPSPSVYIAGFNPSFTPENDYVIITNSTTSSFNLTGWWMKAESESGRYDFPVDFMLNSGASVNVRSGIGTDSATNLYVGGTYSLWTSQNNCAYLRYKDGTLLDKKCVNP